MRACVQYNDVVGTVAADVTDWYGNSLQMFLEKSFKSYDGNRFSCRGCTAYIGERNTVSVSFICLDRENGEFVRFLSKRFWSTEEFFEVFKRLEIVIGKDMEELCPVDKMETYSLEDGRTEK